MVRLVSVVRTVACPSLAETGHSKGNRQTRRGYGGVVERSGLPSPQGGPGNIRLAMLMAPGRGDSTERLGYTTLCSDGRRASCFSGQAVEYNGWRK